MPSPCSDSLSLLLCVQESTYVQALLKYNVRITTGDFHGADYDGEAFIKLIGYDATSEEVKLVETGFAKSRFVRGGSCNITIMSVDVGYIYSVEVRMDPTGDDKSWNLTSIEVQKADNGDDYIVFNCGKWLDEQNPSTSLSRYREMVDYSATAYTSSIDGLAAFDGRVMLQLNGSWGSTDEVELSNYSDTLPSDGSMQTFTFKGCNIGPINSASIRLLAEDSTASAAPKWGLDCIEISRADGSYPSSVFIVKESDGQTKKPVVLEIGSEAVVFPKDRPIVEYKVVVVTSDDPESAYDGDVYFSTYGNEGSSNEVKLSNSASSATNFAAGSSAEFSVKLPDMGGSNGSIYRVQLRADFDSATATNWNIKRVELERLDNHAKMVMNYNSYVDCWCSTAYLYPPSFYNAKVTVKTSDLDGAEFDGDVYLSLSCGWGDGSGEIKLANSTGKFDRGSTEEFQIKVPNVGYLGTVSLRLDGSQAVNSRDKWAIDFIQVDFTDCGSYIALVNDWVDPDPAAPPATFNCCYLSNFTVNIETSPDSEPWDGETYLSLASADGTKSNEVKLQVTDVLRAGSKVQIEGVKLPYLSNLSSAVIRTVATGTSVSWTPTSIDVSGNLFSFGGSLVTAPGWQITGTLLPSVAFEVKVYCSDVRGNGTDGDLSLALEGDNGKTQGELQLRLSFVVAFPDLFCFVFIAESSLWLTGSNDLQRASVSTSTVYLPNVGSLNTLIIRLKDPYGSSSLNAQLRVDKVEILNLTTGDMTTFQVDAWLNATSSFSDASRFSRDSQIGVTNVFADYTFDVYTGDGSGFDGEVQFKLEGDAASGIDSGCLTLGTGGGDDDLFSAGGVDSFVKSCRDLGAPSKLYGNVNGRGNMSAFNLNRVVVTHVPSGASSIFKIPQGSSLYTWNYWTEVPKVQDVTYYISSSTAAGSSKGFSGSVFLKLFGTDGESSESQLDFPYSDPAAVLQPTATDGCYLTAVDVGRLTQIEVRVQGNKSWYPSNIEVTNLDSGVKTVFENDQSIASGSTIAIQKTSKLVDYEVTVVTGDVLGAGTDGMVYLSLSGDQGTTDEVLISSDPSDANTFDPENFKRGNRFTFTFSGAEIGENRWVHLPIDFDSDNDSL